MAVTRMGMTHFQPSATAALASALFGSNWLPHAEGMPTVPSAYDLSYLTH
jgi:hypothetical protein